MKAHVEIPKVSSLRDLIRVVFFTIWGFMWGAMFWWREGLLRIITSICGRTSQRFSPQKMVSNCIMVI